MSFVKFIEPSKPADNGESPRLGAQVIRDLKSAIIERLPWIFGFDSAGTESDVGVKRVPFVSQASDATVEANKVGVYAKDVNGKAELHAIDEDGDIVKLTEAGGVAINGEYVERTALNVYLAVQAGFIFGCQNAITISDNEAQTVNPIVIPVSYAGGSAVIKAGKYYSVSGNVGETYYFVAH